MNRVAPIGRTARTALIGIVILTAASCGKKTSVEVLKKTAQDMRSGNTAPAQYAETLRNDVGRAQEAAGKANSAVQETQQAVDNAVKSE